jgi:hypothetical protein
MSYANVYNQDMDSKEPRRLVVEGDTQRMSLEVPMPLYESLREQAFRERRSMNLIAVEILTAHYAATPSPSEPKAITYSEPEPGKGSSRVNEKKT